MQLKTGRGRNNVLECKTIPAVSTNSDECKLMCDCQNIGDAVMTTKTNNEANVFKSRKDFRTFVAEDGKEMLEEIISSNIQILSLSENSLDDQPDILAVANIHEKAIIECDFKQNIKTLANLLKHTAAYRAKHIVWCINQETPEAMETAHQELYWLDFWIGNQDI